MKPENEKGKYWRYNKEGKYYCDGDCMSWGCGICTCGLLHHFKAMPEAPLAADEKHYEIL